MQTTNTSPAPTAEFETLPSTTPTTEQLFFDGFNSISVSSAMCKVDFYQVVDINAQGKEVRKVMLTIVLPTAALVEMCEKILSGFRENRESMQTLLDQQRDRILGVGPTN